MKHRQNRLSSLIQASFATSAVAITGAAFAQDVMEPAAPASAASGAAADLSKVTVTGFRASLQRAMDVKRNANAIVDAISAEDIGKFPDTNAAESLAHLPGIAVDRLYGEGQRVSINGTDPALNRVLVNGQTVGSVYWGGDPSDHSGRSFNYTLLAPEIIGLMEVFKSPEARIDEGSIGGTVIVHTRNPLDLPANTVRGSLGYTYNDRSKDGDPRASALYSWKNEASNFGILASYTHAKERIAQAGIEFFGYTTGADIGKVKDANGNVVSFTPPKVTGSGDYTTARLPVAVDSDYFEQTRQRDGFQGAIQLKPDDHHKVTLTGIYIKADYSNYSEARYACPGCGDLDKVTSVGVQNGLISSGTVTAGAGNGNQPYAELDANYRRAEMATKSLNLKDEFQWDKWKANGEVGVTQAKGGQNPEYLMKYLLLSGGYSFNYGNKMAGVKYDNGSAGNWGLPGAAGLSAGGTTIPGDPKLDGKYQAGGIDYENAYDFEKYGQIDLNRQVDWGPVNEIMFGVKLTRHNNGVFRFGNRINTTSAVNLTQFGNSTAPSNLYKGLNVSGDINNWPVANLGSVVDYLRNQPQGPNIDSTGTDFTVIETNKAAYGEVNFDTDGFRGNLGVRYVNTDDNSYYYENNVPTNTDTGYRKFLPNFNVAYDIDSTKVVRASIAKVIARPRYSDLSAAISLDDTKLAGSGGNPTLKPYESTNYDIASEWYYEPQAMLGLELFYRDVKNYIVQDTDERFLTNVSTGVSGNYAISSPVNVSAAKVKGLSLLWQQNLWYGFGIQTNWTHALADGSTGLNLPYLSKNTVNIIPYFESGPYSARLVYSWRSQYFTQIGRLQSQDFTDAYKELDFSAAYEINKNVSINVIANNLLNETYYQYSGTKDAPTGFYKNGRTFIVGMNFKL